MATLRGRDMSDGITLIGLEDAAGWEAATAAGLPSQGWHYARGLAAAGLRPQLAVVEAGGARMLLPFHERLWQGSTDIVTLPGLSGALIRPDSAAPLALWHRHAAGRGWVCGYLQLAHVHAGLAVPPPDAIRAHNALFVFDLARWRLDSSVGHNLRKMLRRADRTGVRLSTDQPRLRAAFPALHARSMQRAGAAVEFGAEVLAAWFDDPGLRLFGAETAAGIEAVLLCRVRGAEAEAHLPGATDRGRDLHNWLVWRTVERFAAEGLSHCNIGGYGRAGDGMHETKRRFGAEERPLRALRQIYRPDLYQALCHAAGADPAALYFPPYRAPVPTPAPAA